MKQETYGSKMLAHQSQGHEIEDDVIEYRKKWELEVVAARNAAIKAALVDPSYMGKDFYIVILLQKERNFDMPRVRVFARRSCPTPVYKQTVFKYIRAAGALEFLWTIPDKILYYHILRNAPKLLQDPETRDLAKFVCLMESGEMLEWAKKENGNKKDAVIKIMKQEIECQPIL